MRDSIAVIMAVLGVLLVLAGGTLLVLNALAAGGGLPRRNLEAAKPTVPIAPATSSGSSADATAEVPVVAPDAAPKPPVTARFADAARRLPSADRLIGWGIVLLVLAAVAAGAITFNFQLAADGIANS
jgi:hypothetical protein